MSLSNPKGLAVFASRIGGLINLAIRGQLPKPALQPGVKFWTAGQLSGAATPAVQAAPVVAGVLTAVTPPSGTSTSITGTTLVDTGNPFGSTNQYVGYTATRGSSTLVVTSNTNSTLTGSAGWVGGTPGNGAYSLATPLKQGDYWVAFAYAGIAADATFPSGGAYETVVGPASNTITITDGQSIHVAQISALVNNMVCRFYFGSTTQPSVVTPGFCSKTFPVYPLTASGAGVLAAFDIVAGGDGSFGPQAGQGFGTVQVPALGANGIMTASAASTTTSVSANTAAERIIAVTGIATTDILIDILKPSEQAGLTLIGQRISSAGNVGVKYVNDTAGAITPATENLTFVWWRPVSTAATLYSAAFTDNLVNNQTPINAMSRVHATLRKGSTVAAAGSCPSLAVSNQAANAWAILVQNNPGGPATLATDWVIDYWVEN